jgi:hypothetical protein
MKLTEEAKQSVLSLLAQSPLKADAFAYDFGPDDHTAVSINVKGQAHFYFTLLHPSEIEGKPWEVRESPGGLFHGAETSRFPALEEAIAYISSWLSRVEAQFDGQSGTPPENS